MTKIKKRKKDNKQPKQWISIDDLNEEFAMRLFQDMYLRQKKIDANAAAEGPVRPELLQESIKTELLKERVREFEKEQGEKKDA